MPAFFRLALTTEAVKSLLPNLPHSPLACIIPAIPIHARYISRPFVKIVWHNQQALIVPVQKQGVARITQVREVLPATCGPIRCQ